MLPVVAEGPLENLCFVADVMLAHDLMVGKDVERYGHFDEGDCASGGGCGFVPVCIFGGPSQLPKEPFQRFPPGDVKRGDSLPAQ